EQLKLLMQAPAAEARNAEAAGGEMVIEPMVEIKEEKEEVRKEEAKQEEVEKQEVEKVDARKEEEQDTTGVAVPWRDSDFIKKPEEEVKEETKVEAKAETGGMRVGMALPGRERAKTDVKELMGAMSAELAAIDAAMQKPEMDLAKAHPPVHPAEDMSIYKQPMTRWEKLRIGVLAGVLVAGVVGVGISMKWIQLPRVGGGAGKSGEAASVAPAPTPAPTPGPA